MIRSYLRNALSHFCSETKTMYSHLAPSSYERTPLASP